MKQVVVITGVAGGIGGATARIFSEAGWHVIGVDIIESKNLTNIDHFICGDIADSLASKKIFEKISAEVTCINALINNAAIQICKPLIDTTPDEWDNVMASNVRSVYLTTRNAYPLMKSQGGSVVNISSVHALATSMNMAAYAASKGALISLTRAMAVEFAHDNICVNAILPGAVDTSMLRAGLNRGNLESGDIQNSLDELSHKTVIGRIGKPEEIAHAILFLADQSKSSFITGQMLIVDGGAVAKLSTE